MRILSAVAVALAIATDASSAYSDLIATSDGSAVYFQAKTRFVTSSWFVARSAGSGVSIESVKDSLADVSDSGTVLASAFYSARYCTVGGSECLRVPNCDAFFTIQGPGIDVEKGQRRTFIRLARAGDVAWIDQDLSYCDGPFLVEVMNGLYRSSSLQQIAPANGTKLANQRYGRRAITDLGRALVFAGPQLNWLDATGARPIRHVAGAFEAVADAGGNNIVYVEAPVGKLHWIDSTDHDLGVSGSAPALSEDGRTLVFLGSDQSLQLYDRATNNVRRIGSDTYLTFSLANNNVAFAVTSENRLVRIDLNTSVSSVWLETLPEIDSADVAAIPVQQVCPATCVAPPDRGLAFSHSMIVVFHGRFLDRAGWRAQSAGVEFPLHVLSDTAAWTQIPSTLPQTNSIDIYNPEHPIRFSETARLEVAISCLGTLHQDFSRVVSTDDPARTGEIVHVFLTGLTGVETVADGTPNPTDHLVPVAVTFPLVEPDAFDIKFFGLAPGLSPGRDKPRGESVLTGLRFRLHATDASVRVYRAVGFGQVVGLRTTLTLRGT